MGMKFHLYKVILLLYLTAINPAWADDTPAPLHFIGLYNFDFGSIPLGRLALSIDETDSGYNERLLITSAGVINLFTHHVSDTVARGKRDTTHYFPRYYESYYKTKNKPRHIKLEFSKKGAVTTEINEPPEDRNDRLEVPHSLKDGAYDPLTGLLVLRSGARELKAFDAKRLYKVYSGNCKADTIFIEKKWQEASYCTLSRTPLSGLTRKESKEYNEGEPPLSLYFSTDERRIPLAMSMPVLFGTIHGTLIRECTKWKDCAPEVNVK